MIQSLKVEGLNDRFDYELEFHDDMNIITGPNGSGKTTLLKLIWYLTSGNLHRIIPEISLRSVQIQTREFNLSLQPVEDKVKLKWQFDNGSQGQESMPIVDQQTDVPNAQHTIIESVKKLFGKKRTVLQQIGVLNMLNEGIAETMPGSLFFSTFGKFEGNYTSEPTMVRRQEVLLSEFADALSVGHHRFIPAVSTYSITELLTQKYIVISGDIDSDAHLVFGERRRFLDELVEDIFCRGGNYDGILVGEHIVLGKNQNPIIFANLSSGERELLCILCYNAFSEAKTIFINEPESSLHRDWQRLLPRILEYQGTEKQIFLTTRSPDILIGFENKAIKLENNEESKYK